MHEVRTPGVVRGKILVAICAAVLTRFVPVSQVLFGSDPTPSRADIDMTKAIVDIARPLGISVHDHIIVGKDGHTSLKGLKLI